MLYNLLILLAISVNSGSNTFDHQFENRRMEISFSKIQKEGKELVVGKIINKKRDQGFPGMHVYFKKQDYGAISDIHGNFEIEIPNDQNRLFFSFIKQRRVVLDLSEYQLSPMD